MPKHSFVIIDNKVLMVNMNIEKISWDYISKPKCNNGDIVVLIQYGEAEIAKYITPKPKEAPNDDNDFIFEIYENMDKVEKQILRLILKQYPEIERATDKPFLFKYPLEYFKTSIV